MLALEAVTENNVGYVVPGAIEARKVISKVQQQAAKTLFAPHQAPLPSLYPGNFGGRNEVHISTALDTTSPSPSGFSHSTSHRALHPTPLLPFFPPHPSSRHRSTNIIAPTSKFMQQLPHPQESRLFAPSIAFVKLAMIACIIGLQPSLLLPFG